MNKMCSTNCRRFVSDSKDASASTSSGTVQQQSKSTSSSYYLRNDSSNVSSLLAPDVLRNETLEDHVVKPKRCIYSNCSRKLVRLYNTHCENCYCRDPRIPPRVYLRPRFTDHTRDDDLVATRCCVCNQKDSKRRNKTGNSFVRRRTQPQTFSYEDVVDSYESEFHHDTTNLQEKGESEDDKKQTSVVVNNGDEFKELSDFRKDKYFDCHSVENPPIESVNSTPQHKCVHKFTVNERLMLEPINCDTFGLSRCEVCSKPMECYKRETVSAAAAPPPNKVNKRTSVNAFKRLHVHDLAPPRLNIGSGKERIEIKVPEDVGRQCFYSAVTLKGKAVPTNSFALRFQKGVI